MISGATDYTFTQHAARAAVFPTSEKEHPKTFSVITTLKNWVPGKTNPRKQSQDEGLEESFFKRFGGRIFQLQPENASIKGVTLSVQDFEEAILAPLGASWEKMTLDDGEEIFAMIPPKHHSEEWQNIETELLKKFPWKKREVTTRGKVKELIVTCPNAKGIDNKREVVLHSPSPYECMEKMHKWAAVFFGIKRDICIYNQRGTGDSVGIPSEGGYNLDLFAVYENLTRNENEVQRYSPDEIIITTVCGGTFALAHLIRKAHGQGFRILIENAFPDIQKLIGVGSYFMDMEGLKAKDLSNVKETDYKLREYFEGIEGEDNSRTVILSIDNDNIYNSGSEICKIVNLARSNISHVHYLSPLKEGQHYDRFFYYPNLTRKVLEKLFVNDGL